MMGGRLRYDITIQRPRIVQNGFGANNIEWEDIIHTKADVTFDQGSRGYENDELVFVYPKVFTVRYYHQVDEEDRILWNNKKWRILSLEPDLKKQSLTIRTELINE